jgi:hypothetical protein
METKQKMAKIYGYLVCLVTIITFLICVAGLVAAMIEASDPLYSGRENPKLASFENFKVDALQELNEESVYIPDDQALREMYEAAKNDKIKRVEHRTRIAATVNSLLIVLSIALFIIHWRWMRKLEKVE